MKKTTLLLSLILFSFFPRGYAQQLTCQLLPDVIAYNGEGKYAIMIILVHNSIDLSFSTNLDGTRGSLIQKREKKAIGNQTEYTLTFNAEQARNSRLRIVNPNYNAFEILINLSPNEAKKYFIDDPEYPESKPCNIKHRLYGDKFFLESSYDRAKESYLQSINCQEISEDHVEQFHIEKRIQDIDSIMEYKNRGKVAENLLDYKKASEAYLSAFLLNPEDSYMGGKRREALAMHDEFCQNCISRANSAFNDRDYVSAKINYQKVIDQDCPDKQLAIRRVKNIKDRESYNYKVFAYEFAENAPIGFTSGNYKENYKVSGYFSLRINSNIFSAIRDDYEKAKESEANVSFGWTIMIHKPIWLFFGPGYTGVGEFVDKLDVNKNPVLNEDNEIEQKFKIYSAVSPEAGILGKIPIAGKDRIILRYTFQYRFALKKEHEDFIGKNRHVFGIGICF